MKTCIHIDRITVTNEKNSTLYQSLIDGTDVWIRVPSTFSINPSAELFISCCLLEAMVSNRDLTISPDIPISAVFRRKIVEIQKIYRSWNRKLNIININANNYAEPTPNAGVGVFFSGGIDSSYTLCERIDEITHLITLNGFDRSESPEEWNELIARHKSLAELLGKEIICIEHNFHEFNSLRMICREFQHGLTLAGIAVSTGLAKVFIPASSPYKHLVPWGTHPCTNQ